MKFFLDTANIGEIREAASLGILDGVTDKGLATFLKDWEKLKK